MSFVYSNKKITASYCRPFVQISRLPLSLSELKNLRWLDLKENPLTPSVSSIAGPCSNAEECKNCARNVVEYLNNVKRSVEEEKLRRLNANSKLSPPFFFLLNIL